jgi:hypothetical protein
MVFGPANAGRHQSELRKRSAGRRVASGDFPTRRAGRIHHRLCKWSSSAFQPIIFHPMCRRARIIHKYKDARSISSRFRSRSPYLHCGNRGCPRGVGALAGEHVIYIPAALPTVAHRPIPQLEARQKLGLPAHAFDLSVFRHSPGGKRLSSGH